MKRYRSVSLRESEASDCSKACRFARTFIIQSWNGRCGVFFARVEFIKGESERIL